MKTTLDLPDGLLLEAKRAALEQRRTLKALVIEGLANVLGRTETGVRRPGKIRWVVAEGGVPAETADRVAMRNWMEGHQ